MSARFFDGVQARPHAVSLQVQDGQLLIRAADGALAVDWPLNAIRAEAEPDGTLRLRFGRDPSRLLVQDPADLALLRPALRRLPRQPRGWWAALAACAALLVGAVLLVDAGPGWLAPFVPPSWEARLGQGVEAAMLRSRRCTGTEGQRALDRLVARLAGPGQPPIQAGVADDATVNAFTLPGRRVVVLRGLIDAAGDGDEVAGVVAHELGHVAHRDPTKALLRAMGLNLVMSALGLGGLDGGQAAAVLLTLSYGRAAESAADAYALQSLGAAGLRADGLARFFARIEGKAALPAFLSDHPPTAERRALAATAGPAGAPAFTPVEWLALRTICTKE